MAAKTRTGRSMMREPDEAVNSLPWSISGGGAKIRGTLNAPTTDPADLSLTLDAGLADFRRSLRGDVAAKRKTVATVAVYTAGVERFAAYVTAQGMPSTVAGIRREHIEAFLLSLSEAGRKPSTVHTYYRGLRAFFAWTIEEDELERSPMEKIKPPRIPETPPPVLRPEQVAALLKAVNGKDFESRRDAAIITLFLDTGMRRAELAGLTLERLDRDHQVAIVHGKGDRIRAVPYSDWAAKTVDRYLRLRPRHPGARGTAAVWLGHKGALTTDGIRQMIERRGRQAGIGGLHAHLFRHTFAHEWQAAGGTESGLMQVAGWKSTAMVRRYGASAASERAQAEHGRLNLWGKR